MVRTCTFKNRVITPWGGGKATAATRNAHSSNSCLVFPDGTVFDVLGPFFSNGANNDARMTAHILNLTDNAEKVEGLSNEEFEKYLDEIIKWFEASGSGDSNKKVAIVDRGFQRVIDAMKRKGITAYMPSCAAMEGNQMSTDEANKSRLVTKVRWVVEAFHSRFKKWRFFDNRQWNSNIQRFGPSLKVVAAALNAFRPIQCDTNENEAYHQEIAQRMKEKAEISENALEAIVQKGPLSSRGRWDHIVKFIEDDEYPLDSPQAREMLKHFPKMTIAEIAQKIT